MDFKEIGWQGLYWINVAHDSCKWYSLWTHVIFSRKILLSGISWSFWWFVGCTSVFTLWCFLKTARNMPHQTATKNRAAVSSEQADCSNWKPSNFSIIMFVWVQPFIDCLSVIEFVEGCANRSNAFRSACDTTGCFIQMYVQFLHTVHWNNNNIYRRFMVLPTDNFFVCLYVHTHTYLG